MITNDPSDNDTRFLEQKTPLGKHNACVVMMAIRVYYIRY